MLYLIIAFFFGLAGGVVGRLKGSSFLLWFLISAIVPLVGLIAGWILLKFVIGLITGIATLVIIVLAIVAVVWAWNTL